MEIKVDFQEVNITEQVDEILSMELIEGWSRSVHERMKPGIGDFVDSLIPALNMSFIIQKIAQDQDHPVSLENTVVLSVAADAAVEKGLELLNECYDKMVLLDDPLAVLMEMLGGLSSSLADVIDRLGERGDHVHAHAAQSLLAGFWSIAEWLSHRWIIERDRKREECTICGEKADDEHFHSANAHLDDEGNPKFN